MFERVAIALRSGGMEVAGAISGCDLQGVFRAGRADAESFDAQAEILRRAGRGCHVEDVVQRARIDFKREWFADIPFLKIEARLVREVGQVFRGAGGEIVDADHGMSLAEETVCEVRAQESGCAGYEYALGQRMVLRGSGFEPDWISF
jgi:hypothetical protein